MGDREDIKQLFLFAEEVAPQEPYLANRYVALARKISSRKRISLRAYNRKHCRKCSVFFTSKTLQVRTRKDHVVYQCRCCGNMTRIRK
ncbi:MAG: ribonuclease P [Candidatus Woesearchaeota archaeon]|nr:ribonuclease P [Candidatus Woesearchaeota archaeon]